VKIAGAYRLIDAGMIPVGGLGPLAGGPGNEINCDGIKLTHFIGKAMMVNHAPGPRADPGAESWAKKAVTAQ